MPSPCHRHARTSRYRYIPHHPPSIIRAFYALQGPCQRGLFRSPHVKKVANVSFLSSHKHTTKQLNTSITTILFLNHHTLHYSHHEIYYSDRHHEHIIFLYGRRNVRVLQPKDCLRSQCHYVLLQHAGGGQRGPPTCVSKQR
jgi:hypothetical protein